MTLWKMYEKYGLLNNKYKIHYYQVAIIIPKKNSNTYIRSILFNLLILLNSKSTVASIQAILQRVLAIVNQDVINFKMTLK